MSAVRIALMNIRLVMRTKVALFFTFFFPLVFLFAYAGLFAHGNPQAVLYMFGPVVTLNIMGSGFWGLGLQSVMQRERGSLRRYRLAPLGPGTIVIGNLLANYLLGLPTAGLLVAVACLVFDMPLKISLLSLLFLVTVGSFAFSGFGLIIASVANTMQEAQVYNNLAWLTLLFLSGTTVPLPLLPHWIQRVATFLPATYLVSAFQAVMVQGEALTRHAAEISALVVSGSFGLLFAWKLFRWEKEERIAPRRKAWALTFILPFLLIGLWLNAYANPTRAWASAYALIERQTEASGGEASRETGTIIENFESAQASEELLKNWQVSVTAPASSDALAEAAIISPGAAGTGHALRLMGRIGANPDATVTVRHLIHVETAQDFHGMALWIRGSAPFARVSVAPPGATTPHLPEVALKPASDWQVVQIPCGGLGEEPPDPTRPMAWVMELAVPGAVGEFFVEIDEIRTY